MQHEKANVVIVGGGLFGCAIAYYYSRNNPEKKVIVLERQALCSSATSRAAALITRVRSKKNFIPLSLETYHAIKEMEKQLGESLGVKYVGVLHVAATKERVRELEELVGIAKEFRQPAEFISTHQAHKMSPWLQTDDVMQVAYMPGEGYCDPYLLGTFYARCAKANGAELRQGVEVSKILMDGNTAVGVQTSEGKIEADVTIVASGAWAPSLAMQVNIGLPMAPVRSQYWITDRNELFPENSPIVLLPDAQAYARPESGSLLFGIRERKSLAVSPEEIPSDISHFEFSADRGMGDLQEVIDKLARFFPKVYDIGLKNYVAGFSGYTPDNYLSMGMAAGLRNLLFATGCAGAGISVSGGVGFAFAEMAAGKKNPYDFSAFALDRFGVINPLSTEWLEKCALARAQKVSG
jgi:4-methylaminobutanoate oxidase (formaldehyde-forming)